MKPLALRELLRDTQGNKMHIPAFVVFGVLFFASTILAVRADGMYRGSLVRHTDDEVARRDRYEWWSSVTLAVSCVALAYALWAGSSS